MNIFAMVWPNILETSRLSFVQSFYNKSTFSFIFQNSGLEIAWWFSMICWPHKVSNLYTYTITVADVYFSNKYKEKKMFQLFNVLDHASETTVHYYVLLHRYVHYVLCNQSHCIEVAQGGNVWCIKFCSKHSTVLLLGRGPTP